jgi:hypothetical protein
MLATSFPPVTMTSSDGSTRTLDLKQTSPGLPLGVIDVDRPTSTAPTTARCAPWRRSVIPTPSCARCGLAAPPAGRTGSGCAAMRVYGGRYHPLPLLPRILVALAFLMAIGSAWWREGR